MAPRETENNAFAKFWVAKQRVLWNVMVFSGVANCLKDREGRGLNRRFKVFIHGFAIHW